MDWMTAIVLSVLGLVVAAYVAFSILLVFVAYFEKRLVDPIAEIRIDQATRAIAERDDQSLEATALKLSPYVAQMCDDARQAAFTFGSIAVHKMVPRIKVSGALWISQDRRILMSSSSGSVLKMPASKTLLISKLSNGDWVITADHYDDADTTGGDHHEYLENAPFPTLLQWHMDRIARDPRVVTLPMGSPFKLMSDRYKSVVQRIFLAGNGRYRDVQQQYWSNTWRSSLRYPLRFLALLSRTTSSNSGPQSTRAIADVRRTLSTGDLVAVWKSPLDETAL
jgi:hypothetical protein